MSTELLAIADDQYQWLQDFLARMQFGDDVVTESDHDQMARLVERMACCDRCEGIWNDAVLEAAGYQKIGVGHDD